MNFFYIHVPKTGGTSLRDIFYKNLPEGETLFVDRENDIKFYTEENLKDLRAIGGHLPLWKFMRTDRGKSYPCIKFAVLRDPLDRLLSLYNYLSVSKHEDHRKYYGLGFEDFIEVFAGSKPPSLHMCYSFAKKGTYGTARWNILYHNVAIYSLEDIGDLLEALGALLGVDVDLQHLNKSRRSIEHSNLSGLDLSLMRDDLNLYAAYKNGDFPVLTVP